MSGQCIKFIEYYRLDKEKNKIFISRQSFDQNQLPLSLPVPDSCNYFECYSLITDEILAEGKLVDLVSDKLNLKKMDFSLPEKEGCPNEVYAAVCLKSLPEYSVYNLVGEIETIHNIGYGSITHADFIGSFDYVQHPQSLSLENVIVKDDCNRFELFDSLKETFNTNNGDVNLNSRQKLNHKVYYVGYLKEVEGKSKTVLAEARDGQSIVCQMGELINPELINNFGHIMPEPASPEI